MRLTPIHDPAQPDYPDLPHFRENRREFLRRLGLAAGTLVGAQLAGCGREPEPTPGSSPPPTEQHPEGGSVPSERLGGLVAEPFPDDTCPEEPKPETPPLEEAPSGGEKDIPEEGLRGRVRAPEKPGP